MPDTNEEYFSIRKNQIVHPPGHAPCEEVYFRDRKKLNGRSKNQNPVRRDGSGRPTYTGFNEDDWYSLVDYATVYGKDDIWFTFKNGMEVKA